MQFLSSFTRKFTSRSISSEEDGQELEDHNASPTQSARSQQIIADITFGISICSICTDPVSFGRGNLYNIWHCKECHNVYHYNCAKTWELQSISNRSFAWLGLPAWKCPTCSAPQAALEGPRCWCGKQRHGQSVIGNPNACENVCGRIGKCAHYIDRSCVEKCHPGPCKYPCSDQCSQGPIAPPRPPNAWDRFCRRVSRRGNGTGRGLARLWLLVASVYGLLGVLIHYHIRWWSMPYRYPRFAVDYGTIETFLLLLPGLFILAAIGGFLAVLAGEMGQFLAAAFNLNTRRRNTRKTLGGLLLWAFFLGLFALIPLGIIGGPPIAWYNQMKSSCNGLDARASLDGPLWRQGRSFYVRPSNRFVVRDLNSPDHIFDEYDLAARLGATSNRSDDSFQYFHRLSYVGNDNNYAVDIDIPNREWRMLELDRPDNANSWLAYGSRQNAEEGTFEIKPIFIQPKTTLLLEGNFTKIDSEQPSMLIDDLDLVITDLWGFVNDCDLEPFVRVFNITGMTDFEEIPEFWTTKPHAQEIMRTASFGHGRQRLDMCIRQVDGNATHNWEEVTEQVAKQMVPFAIITAYRMRAFESGYRGFQCGR